MSLLAFRIGDSSFGTDLERLNADIDVLRVKARKRGFPFPEIAQGFTTVQSLLPYLTRVSAHLGAGHVAEARAAASQLVSKPSAGAVPGG